MDSGRTSLPLPHVHMRMPAHIGFGLAVGIVAMTAMFALAYYLFAWRHVGKEQASERMKNSEMSVCVPLVETGAADKVMCKFAIETNFMEQ
jgi:hypothetical protein